MSITCSTSFLTGLPHRLSVGKGRAAFDAMLLDIDDETGKARSIERIRREELRLLKYDLHLHTTASDGTLNALPNWLSWPWNAGWKS